MQTLQANTMDVRCQPEAVALLYLNPPYDWESGESNNQRLESVFLEHSYRWLKAGGVLLFVIPQLRLAKCARLLSEHSADLRVFRLTESACLQYRQIVVLGKRRKRLSLVKTPRPPGTFRISNLPTRNIPPSPNTTFSINHYYA